MSVFEVNNSRYNMGVVLVATASRVLATEIEWPPKEACSFFLVEDPDMGFSGGGARNKRGEICHVFSYGPSSDVLSELA